MTKCSVVSRIVCTHCEIVSYFKLFLIQIDCYAINPVTQQSVETQLQLRVRVLDINDNPPVFSQTIFEGSIVESSMDSKYVTKVIQLCIFIRTNKKAILETIHRVV